MAKNRNNTTKPELWDEYIDESIPVHPEFGPSHPMVVFDNHNFCAGKTTLVRRMPGPHMHSQIEINFVLEGEITYWLDGKKVVLHSNSLNVFWGMVPHQVVHVFEPTHFVVFYIPIRVFLSLPNLNGFRDAIMSGALAQAQESFNFDREMFLNWRQELLSEDNHVREMVREELLLRLKRMGSGPWKNLSDTAQDSPRPDHQNLVRSIYVEQMSRFIAEHAHENINIANVAASANLNPNYAMTLYKKVLGITINQSLTRNRLDQAQSMLISTEKPITAIAMECGFGSISGFYEAFQQRFKEKPSAFRKSNPSRQDRQRGEEH